MPLRHIDINYSPRRGLHRAVPNTAAEDNGPSRRVAIGTAASGNGWLANCVLSTHSGVGMPTWIWGLVEPRLLCSLFIATVVSTTSVTVVLCAVCKEFILPSPICESRPFSCWPLTPPCSKSRNGWDSPMRTLISILTDIEYLLIPLNVI